jgi:hypothetical protein
MIPNSIYMPLLEAISAAGADMTDDCQDFLSDQFSKFPHSESEFVEFVSVHAKEWFLSCNSPPEWIQNAEWQFDEGRPMCFVGQLLISPATGMFHDEAAIFVFATAKGSVKTVIQIS